MKIGIVKEKRYFNDIVKSFNHPVRTKVKNVDIRIYGYDIVRNTMYIHFISVL